MLKLKSINKFTSKLLSAAIIFPALICAQPLEIGDISPKQVESKFFSLAKNSYLEINAVVGEYHQRNDLLSNCWILNNATHQLVWEFSRHQAKRNRAHKTLNLKETITLPGGNYQVFYAVNPQKSITRKKIWGMVFDSDPAKYYSSDWGIRISPTESSAENFRLVSKPEANKNVVIEMTNIYDDEYHKKGFELTAPIKLSIYALGEGMKSGRQMSDFGWISNLKTRQRVWEMEYRKTEHAGGALKNRKFEGRILLPVGKFMVHYVSDDSHSNERWNQMPPFDPDAWGITLAVDDEKDLSKIKTIEEFDSAKPIIELTRIKDNEFICQGFELLAKTKIHIFALGECSQSRKVLVDYGWITNASTREIIWQMDYRDTDYAGGAQKNRLFDGSIDLPKGKYFLCYRTDDSHAFRSWNEAQPWLPEAWGITISCEEPDCEKNIRLFDEPTEADILVSLIRVGDDEKVYQKLEITTPTEVRIYALGEGRNGNMFDFGWIENDAGDKVWEMEYQNTKPAGGGTKNRMVNEVISLAPGTYRVFFQTDDSHSYGNWNTTPPTDEEHWGITIIRQH